MPLTLRQRRAGFSLLEMALTLGIAGTVLSGIWQMMGATGQTRDAALVASQVQALAGASAQYINTQRTTLLALPGLAAIDGSAVIRVKITDSDTGDTATSIIGAGYLPSAFVNQNSYGQTYRLYVRREDGGTIGIADSSDKLVGLLISTGGASISDTMGARIASLLGAAGGFFYLADNSSSPATLARGNTDGWQVDTTLTGWSNINGGGTVTTAGHLAVLTNFTAPNISGSGGGGAPVSAAGSGSIDGLSDGVTDYSTRYNVYLGSGVAENDTIGGYNVGVGYQAMRYRVPTTIAGRNTALGYEALRGGSLWPGVPTGIDNVGIGYLAGGYVSSGSNNVAVGSLADRDHQSNSNRVAIGYMAGISSAGDGTTFVGSYAGASTSGYPGAAYSTVIGAHSGKYTLRAYNTLVGAYIGVQVPDTGTYNTAMGYQALHFVTSASERNTVFGYRAGYNLSSGTDNILLGNNTDAPNPTDSYKLNIGNYIYGDLTTQQMNIGSPTMVTGLAFDVGSRTDSGRLAKGTSAQEPACTVSLTGAQRWRETVASWYDQGEIRFCDGSSWISPEIIPGGSTPPTMPTYDGYIVLSESKWDGNLGAELGTRKKCLAELTTYDWMGKATAVANGQLVMGKVEAMIWWQEGGGSCADKQFHPVPNARYYFAVANRPTVGGAYVITNSTGDWFPDANSWSGANQFDGFFTWWGGNIGCDAATYGCGGYISNLSTKNGSLGYSAPQSPAKGLNGYYYMYDQRSYSTKLAACNTTQRLVCLVHP